MKAMVTFFSLQRKVVSKCEWLFEKKTILIPILLLMYYFVSHIYDILIIRAFAPMAFPLRCIYMSNSVIFQNMSVNPELASTIIAPSNITLLLLPGIFILTWFLGSVSGIFTFLFVFQMGVPLLVFYLLRRVSSNVTAVLFGLFSTSYFTAYSWWAPDWIIQPIMLLSVLFLLLSWKNKIAVPGLVLIGLLTGLILILKHNIGVFFAIMCGTWIFFRSLSISDNAASAQLRKD